MAWVAKHFTSHKIIPSKLQYKCPSIKLFSVTPKILANMADIYHNSILKSTIPCHILSDDHDDISQITMRDVVRWTLQYACLGTASLKILNSYTNLEEAKCNTLIVKQYVMLAVLPCRARHIQLPDGLGQVKLPVWQMDFREVFFYILYKQIRIMHNFRSWAGKIFGIRQAQPCNMHTLVVIWQ